MEPEETSDMQQVPEEAFELQASDMQQAPEETFALQASPYQITGYFERVSGGTAYGWFCVPASPAASMYAYIWFYDYNIPGWVLVGQGQANNFRADIASYCGGNGSHAFAIPLSTNAYGWYYYDTFTLGLMPDGTRPRTNNQNNLLATGGN